ncbi:hypothetical protein OAU50_04970 [Planctomycetota bacterium]|nr:hypothetical protein [Planctomycetota bacterium]
MKKFIALMAVVAMLGLAACGSTGIGGGDNCGGSCGGPADSSATTLEYMTEATYWVQLHADPVVGQYWETTMEANGMTMTNRWQVVKVDGDSAVIENQMKMDSEYAVSNYVLAYEVNLAAGEGEANVTKAWKGLPGEAGTEMDIMAKPEATGCAGCAPEVQEEDFSGLEIAGGTFEGKIYTTEYAKTWMASNGWFGGMVKMEAGENITELTAMGDDATALLTWE